MKLSNLDFSRLLPQFMRDDIAVACLASTINEIIPDMDVAIKRLSTWDCIDTLSESELDELAWELDVAWYDQAASIEIKRDILKQSDMVHKHLGTKWAVENVVKSYFGDGYILEWFEYDGDPGHFEVHSSNPSLSADLFDEFTALLDKVKRASAKLDAVVISMTGDVPLAAGFALHEAGYDRYDFGS